MKALKIIAIIFGAVVVLGALLICLALTPAVQTWAVRKAVANQPGMSLQVNRVAAGLSAADLTGVHLVKDGMVVDVKHVSARYSAMDFVSHKRINVDDLTVEDLVVDMRGAKPAPAANKTATPPTQKPAQPEARERAANAGTKPASPPFNGVLNGIQLPYDVRVARFSVPGKVLLSNEQTATFELHGSNIETGQRGTIEWKADLTNTAAKAPARAVHTTGTAAVHLTNDRRIDAAEVNAVASAEGPQLPADQVKLEAKAEQVSGGNENYHAAVSLEHGGTAQPLFALDAAYTAAAHQIAGKWTLTVRTEQVGALLNGLGLPDVAANGTGQFSAKPDTGAATATGEIQADVSNLQKVSAELAAIGRLHVQTKFDAGLDDNIAHLQQFTLDATDAQGRQLAEIRTLQRVGYSLTDSRVTFENASADLARINVNALPLAWVRPFVKAVTIDSGDLSLALAVAAAPDGSHVRVTAAEPLQLRNVTVHNGAQKLADRLTLTVKPQADYTADELKAELNDLAVTMPTGDTVNGRFTADITNLKKTPAIAFTTDTQAKFVAALKPYVPVETGPMTVTTKSAGSMSGQTLRFATSSTHINRTDGPLVASIDLQQPLTINLQNNAIAAEKPDAEALKVQLGQIPLQWAEGFVPNSKFGGEVAGGTISVVLRSLDDLTASATQPITIHGINVSMNNQAMLQNVDFTADFTAAKKGQTVTYNVRRVEAKSGAATLLNVVASGNATLGAKTAIVAKGSIDADLAALTQQPAAAGSTSLAKGTLKATFDANVADAVQANAKVIVSDLVAKQNNQPLGVAELNLTASVQPDGSSVLKVPFTLTNGSRKSDVTLDGKLAKSGNAMTFDGRISSSLLVVDDLQQLAALAPSSKTSPSGAPATPATPAVTPSPAHPQTGTPTARPAVPAVAGNGAPQTPATTAARDTQPVWAGFGGKIDVDLKEIDYGKDYKITGVRGAAAITPTQLALTSLEGKFKDNPFKVSATIDFDGQQPQPYTLAATTNVNNFDVGAILQAANPNEKPQLETKVTLDIKLNGKGTTLPNLAQNAYGTFDVNGSKGVLRALGNKTGSVVGGGSMLLQLGGALAKSDTAVALGDLTHKLAELPFDSFTMHVERGADLNLKVSRLEFLSPDTRITGTGEITNEPGVAIENQPMQITIQLAGKDDMGFLLNRLKLLSGQQDEKGFYVVNRTFKIGGTPAKTDASDLWKSLAGIAAQNVPVQNLLKMFGH